MHVPGMRRSEADSGISFTENLPPPPRHCSTSHSYVNERPIPGDLTGSSDADYIQMTGPRCESFICNHITHTLLAFCSAFFSTVNTVYLLLSREHFPRLLPFNLDASITSWCLYILHIRICLTMIQASFVNHRCPQILPFVYLGFNSQSVISSPSLVFCNDASSRRPPSYPWLSSIACSVALCFLFICVCGASFEFLIVQCSCL